MALAPTGSTSALALAWAPLPAAPGADAAGVSAYRVEYFTAGAFVAGAGGATCDLWGCREVQAVALAEAAAPPAGEAQRTFWDGATSFLDGTFKLRARGLICLIITR